MNNFIYSSDLVQIMKQDFQARKSNALLKARLKFVLDTVLASGVIYFLFHLSKWGLNGL